MLYSNGGRLGYPYRTNWIPIAICTAVSCKIQGIYTYPRICCSCAQIYFFGSHPELPRELIAGSESIVVYVVRYFTMYFLFLLCVVLVFKRVREMSSLLNIPKIYASFFTFFVFFWVSILLSSDASADYLDTLLCRLSPP